MKRFTFTLGRILDYRQSMLDKEKNSLMQLFANRNAVELRIEQLQSQQDALAAERTQMAAVGTTVLELQRQEMKLDAARRAIEAELKELARVDELIDAQRQVVTKASQEVRGLELLRDKQREEYNQAQQKEEEERISELISSNLVRQQQENQQ